MAEKKQAEVVQPIVGSELPEVPLGAVTEASLAAEAAALGDAFGEVTTPAADLVADAEEMLEAEGDVPDLVERDYPVTPHLFSRVRILKALVAAASAGAGAAAALAPGFTEAAEAARVELLDVRAKIAGIGKAAGLPASLFSLETHRTQRLNVVLMRMEDVLRNVADFRARMPDRKRLDALVVRARQLIDEQKEARRRARLMRAERTIDVRQQERYERLLLNVLQYLSSQGLAAYPDDPVREPRYRLDHVYGRKPSRVGDPGGGGGTPANG